MARREVEPLEPLLKRDDVMTILNISKRQFYRFVESRELPAVKIGSEWRVKPSVLRRFIDERRVRRPYAGKHYEVSFPAGGSPEKEQ